MCLYFLQYEKKLYSHYLHSFLLFIECTQKESPKSEENNMKIYAIMILFALAVMQTTTAAEARHHFYGNGFYGNGYGDGCGYHRRHHRRW